MKEFHQTKVGSLLLSFDSERILAFSRFVHSPYFNTSDTICSLMDALLRSHPLFDETECSLERLHAKVFGEQKSFDYHRINNVMSDLYELSLRFLVQVSRDGETGLESWRVLPRLRQARLDTHFKQQAKKYSAFLEEHKDDDFYHLYRGYYLNEMIWYSSSHAPQERFGFLQEQYNSILNFILIRIGRLATLLSMEEYQSSVHFSLPLLEELLHFFEGNHVPDFPVVQLYQHALLLVRFHRDDDYLTLRRLRSDYKDVIADSDYSFVTAFLNHYVVYTNNEHGRTDLYPHLIEDQRETLERRLYDARVVMPFADFALFVRSAGIANDVDWLKKLIAKYLERVVPDEQDNCRAFALATIARCEGDLRTSLAQIQMVNFRLPILAIQMKDFAIMLLFELEEFELCMYAVDSFRHYLKSLQALPPRYIEAHQDFIRLVKSLISVKTQARSKKRINDLAKLKTSIRDMKYNTFNVRMWLQKQVDLFSA